MSQLLALAWLKWALFRNSMRSKKAVAGRVASTAGMLIALAASLVVAAGLGFGAYLLAADSTAGGDGASELRDGAGYILLLFMLTVAYMMWALTPLALGGGNRFGPTRMLLYPVSLAKLFAIDFITDLTGLTAVFIVPSVFALGAGVGLARGRLASCLLVSLCAVAFGLSLSKLLSVGIGALIKSRRTRGETLLALLGALLGLTGAMMGQLMPFFEQHGEYLEPARWTPPGAAAYALSRGTRAGHGADFTLSLLTLAAYAFACLFAAYRVARRTALGGGGGGGGSRKRARPSEPGAGDARAAAAEAKYAGWRLPLVSPEFSAVFEKELRYAVRNAQLRVIALMAVGLTILLRIGPAGTSGQRLWGGFTPYAEGSGTVFGVIYIFMLVAPVSTNLFGYDGSGMRALVLSPVSRRTILLAKNAAVALVSLLLVVVGVSAGGLIIGDLSPRVTLFALLSFVTSATLFAPVGNWLSIQFPKRVQFGKRMNRSGVAGLLLVPVFFLLLLPPAASIAAAHFAQSYAFKYVILAAFAILSVGMYALLLPVQARTLERRELKILEAVTGRGGGGGDEQITG
ncbi:MAG TPA: ABC-2 transporter permease [Pyrinomonadaceae bacterium]|nr:ABC-2 transporter permease [Pyrinomonadaceae bacterium]